MCTFFTLYILTSHILIPNIALQHLVWKLSSLCSIRSCNAQFSLPQRSRFMGIARYKYCLILRGMYGLYTENDGT